MTLPAAILKEWKMRFQPLDEKQDIAYISALKKYKMSKFYTIIITNDEFKIEYDLQKYQQEKSLDGKYVIESTVKKENMDAKQVREKYKDLQKVEHAFRDMKTDKLNIRSI